MNIETRVSKLGAESGKLVGVAIAYGTRSQDLGGFVEIIEPGAFSKHLATNPDVRAIYEHDNKSLLGRTTSGTLKLSDSPQGLAVEIDPPATRAGSDCVELVRRGDLSGMSFGFTVVRDHWDMKAKPPVRRVIESRLHEVTITSNPAYLTSAIALRCAAGALMNATEKAWCDYVAI
ncbi:HK97 family phage prohead protease [Aeromonas veronii]